MKRCRGAAVRLRDKKQKHKKAKSQTRAGCLQEFSAVQVPSACALLAPLAPTFPYDEPVTLYSIRTRSAINARRGSI